MPGERERTCGALIGALWAELDWPLLGAAYCEGDARGFFDEARREQLLEVGLRLADELAGLLPPEGPRRSLYLGAAVAELVPVLVEHVVLRREVLWFNLPGAERDELARALDAVGAAFEQGLPRPDPTPLAQSPLEPCDHLWMASVLTDPDAFPALHDELYERAGTAEATGRGDAREERARAGALIDALLARGAPGCLLTTSAEEWALLAPRLAARGLHGRAARELGLSALVGDRLLCARLEAD